MRKTMGRFVDGCTDEQLGRLISARAYNNGRMWWTHTFDFPAFERGCGCLVGTAFAGDVPVSLLEEVERALSCATDLPPNKRWAIWPAAWRYPRAVDRFGKDRIVRAIRARAQRVLSERQAAMMELLLAGSAVEAGV